MRRFLVATTLLVFVATVLLAQSDSTPLGDYARGARASTSSKTGVRVYNNDNLSAKSPNPSVTQAPLISTDPVKPCNNVLSGQGSNNLSAEDTSEIKAGQSPAERQKAYAAWKSRIGEKREQVEKLGRELEDLQTNAPQSVSVLHIWPDDVKYKMMLQEKQKGL